VLIPVEVAATDLPEWLSVRGVSGKCPALALINPRTISVYPNVVDMFAQVVFH